MTIYLEPDEIKIYGEIERAIFLPALYTTCKFAAFSSINGAI